MKKHGIKNRLAGAKSSLAGAKKRLAGAKKKLAGAASYSRTLVRIKHFRGRKVHSPFVYGIVRNAIMKTRPQGDDRALFDELRARGLSIKRAAQIQNLYAFRGFADKLFVESGEWHKISTENTEELQNLNSATLCLAMPELGVEATEALVERARGTGAAICVMSPYAGRSRRRMAARIVAAHRHTSVDNRGFLLIFTDERLPKQHFKL